MSNQMQMQPVPGFPSMEIITTFTTGFMPESVLEGFPLHMPTSVSETVTIAHMKRECQGDDVCGWSFKIKEDNGRKTHCKLYVTKTEEQNHPGGFVMPAESSKYANSRNDTECGRFLVSTHHNRLGVTVLNLKHEENQDGQTLVSQVLLPYSDAELCAGNPVDRSGTMTRNKKDYMQDPNQFRELDEFLENLQNDDEDDDNDDNDDDDDDDDEDDDDGDDVNNKRRKHEQLIVAPSNSTVTVLPAANRSK